VDTDNLTDESEANPPRRPIDNERASRLKAGLLQFVVTMKNMALYPETNRTNVESVTSLHLWLNEFLSHSETLVLEVARDKLLADDGAVVYQEKPSDQILAGPMFRDGIQAISFEHGLSERELRTFLSILLRFRNQDSDQDDLVASLWEASLSNIKYIVSSEYEQVGPEFEVSAMKAAKAGQYRDIDTPWDDEALSPMGVEGAAPVAKPIASLFALAESTDFFSSSADGLGQGAVAPGASGTSGASSGQAMDGLAQDAGTAGDQGSGPAVGSGFGFGADQDSLAEDGDFESSGFGPFDSRHAGDVSAGGSVREGDDSFSSLAASREARAGEDGQAAGPAGADGEDGQGTGGDGGQPGEDEDGELDIDMGSVAEAFKDLENKSVEEAAPRPPTNPLTLELLKQRPAADGPELEERLRHWGLSGREVKQIAALVRWDETRNYSYDTMELTKILLGSPILKTEHLGLISFFVTNEARTSLRKMDLKYFNSFFQGLKDRAASGALLDGLLLKELQHRIDGSDILCCLVDPGPSEEAIGAGFEDLRYFLYQLSPIGVQTLTTFLPKMANQRLWGLIIELVAYDLLRAGPRTSEAVSRLNDRALAHMIRLVQNNIKSLPPQLVNSLTRHKSPAVREAIARAILEHDPDNFHSLCAHMVLDADPAVLRIVRPAIAARRNSAAEGYLFSYLRTSYSKDRHDEDRKLLECYRIYGKCASASALPFLEEVLMKKDFKTFLSRSVDSHKLGAALALFLMPQDYGASEILHKASRSSFRNVRQAYLEAKQIITGLG
jgi:hypothetical protein